MPHLKGAGAAAVIALGLTAGLTGANAASSKEGSMGAAPRASETRPPVQSVQWRGERHSVRTPEWRRSEWNRYRHYYGDNIAEDIFVDLGFYNAYTDTGVSIDTANAAMERCAQEFRSFEWDTGLYTTYDGEKRLCPYLT